MEILVEIFFKNGNFGRKRKFRSKIKTLLKNRNLGRTKENFFGQKSKRCLKIEILVEKNFCLQIRNYGETTFF